MRMGGPRTQDAGGFRPLVAKQRFDSPESLYNRPRPLPKPQRVRLKPGARKRLRSTAQRLANRLSDLGIAEAMATAAADDPEGAARRAILRELIATVPGFHRLTEEQRAVLAAVKRAGLPGDWLLIMARFGAFRADPALPVPWATARASLPPPDFSGAAGRKRRCPPRPPDATLIIPPKRYPNSHVGWRRNDLRGRRFGALFVRGPVPHKQRWLCRCDCGNDVAIRQSSLLDGNARHCGCGTKARPIKPTKAKAVVLPDPHPLD